MAHINIPAALAAILAPLALAGCGPAPEPEPLPTIDIPTFTTEAPEPTEAGPTIDPEVASNAKTTCLDALKSQYTAGLTVDGKPAPAGTTYRDLYPGETPEDYAAAGIDPDADLVLVVLDGHTREGRADRIECVTNTDGSTVANLTTTAK